MNNMVWHSEEHPKWYRDIPVMKTLILGSFPPTLKKHDYPFYYPNSQNRFWKILAEINNTPLKYLKTKKENDGIKTQAVQERHDIMKSLRAGVQNVGLTIKRKGESAKDKDIVITDFQNILSIIETHKELDRILLPGFSAKNSTYWSFIKYLQKNDISIDDIQKPYLEMMFEIIINERKIQCVVLNSTSTATKIPYDTVLKQFEKYLIR